MGVHVLLKSLECPHDIKDAPREFEAITKHLNEKEKGKEALKTIITICRLLDNVEWKLEVQGDVLAWLSCQLCATITELSDVDYKRYVAALCNIHRCVVNKKCSASSSVSLIGSVFNKLTLKLTCDQSKNYFILLVDSFQALQNEKLTKELLDTILKRVLQYLQIIDVLVIDNFLWLVRKYDSLLNKVDPEYLNDVYHSFFFILFNNKNLKTKSKRSESHLLFKRLLYIMAVVHDNSVNCEHSKKETVNLFFNLSLSLLEESSAYNKIFRDIFTVFPIFTTRVEHMGLHLEQLINIFNDTLLLLQSSKQDQILDEVCMTFKKILCSSLSAWLSVPDEVWKKYISVALLISVLQLISTVVKVLCKSQLQTVQCLNCDFKSAIHDSLSLSYYGGMFCIKSVKCNMNVQSLFNHTEQILIHQTHNLKILFVNGCPNWKTFWRKMENSQHNDSISLYSNKSYELSHKMFNVYIHNYIKVLDWNHGDLSYLARGLYNMAICQSDLQLNYAALISCYISLAINYVISGKGASSLPHYQLIIQIKAKFHSQIQSTMVVEHCNDTSVISCQGKSNEELQQLNIWNACKHFLSNKENAIFVKIFSILSFGNLLLSELQEFLQSWPSTNSISGICGALQELCYLSNSSYKHAVSLPILGVLDATEVGIVCGKAVTLLIKHAAKLTNGSIANMITCTSDLLENLSSNQKLPKSFIKLLHANALFAQGLCKMYEKRKLSAQNPLVEVVASIPFAPYHPNIHPDDMCTVPPAHQYLSLQVENEMMEYLYKATCLWRHFVIGLSSSDVELEDKSIKEYVLSTCDVIELCCQVFALHNNQYSIIAADIAFALSDITNNTVCILRSLGFLLENTFSCKPELDEIIMEKNKTVYKILAKDEEKPECVLFVDACLEYLLCLSMYYHNVGSVHQGALILSSVSNRILNLYMDDQGRKLEDIKLTYVKMLKAQGYFISHCHNKTIKNDLFSILTCHVNANIDCGDIVKIYEHSRGRLSIISQRMWLESGSAAGEVALSLGLVRRARALLRAPLSAAQRLLLPRRASYLLTFLAHADLAAERLNDCMVKIEGLKYILGEETNEMSERNEKTINFEVQKVFTEMKSKKSKIESETCYKNFEMVLDVPTDKGINCNSGSPTFRPTPFAPPAFVHHVHTCGCYKCHGVCLFVLYIHFFKLQAQIYFRSGEANVAETFYRGGMKCIKYLFTKLIYIKENFEKSLVSSFGQEIFNEYNYNEMLNAQARFLNDAVSYFITEDEIETAQELNEQVLEIVHKHLKSNYFLYYEAEEHQLFMLQNNVFNKHSMTASQLDVIDDLQNDVTSKLIITPEKLKQSANFLTPCNRKVPAINRVKRNLGNASPISSTQKETTNYHRPPIKLKLEEADNENEITESEMVELFEGQTPVPKLKNCKPLLFDVPKVPSRIHSQKHLDKDENKTQSEKKSTRPRTTPTKEGPAIKILFGDKPYPKVYANKAARNTMKLTISPNNVLIEKHNPSTSDVDFITSNSKVENQVKQLRNKKLIKDEVKSAVISSNRTAMTAPKPEGRTDINKRVPTATRCSTRKKL